MNERMDFEWRRSMIAINPAGKRAARVLVDQTKPKAKTSRPYASPNRRHVSPKNKNPDNVKALKADHDAIKNGRPLFLKSIVRADHAPRVLVSGKENRKLGRTVMKGPWRGFPIYHLTLPERMTCPRSCEVWDICYGDAMPFARRNAPGVYLEASLLMELKEFNQKHARGFVVRLHTLGDFYSPEYVDFWGWCLENFPALHIFGFTANLPDAQNPIEAAIGQTVSDLKSDYPKRFRIRWSRRSPAPDSATVIRRIPESRVVPEGIICPAEIGGTECCATCGLCWHPAASDKTIAFVLHGRTGAPKKKRMK